MKILAVCRGAPGLGRVAPAYALAQTLRTMPCGVQALFATYGAGRAYLAALGEQVIDLGTPDGLFIDPVGPQALHVLELAEQFTPDLILIDGEFYLPSTLRHLGTATGYLANPHDLLGTPNTFRRVNRLMLGHADAVIVSSLNCAEAHELPGLVVGARCLEVPAIVKDLPLAHRPHAGPPRVLVSMGGGSLRADPRFREATDAALAAILAALAALVAERQVARVTLVAGADLTPPVTRVPRWLTIATHPTELTTLYPDHEVLVVRAGRNATAEARYAGIPTVLVPVTADRHRGGEQLHNAQVAAHSTNIFPLPDRHRADTIQHVLRHALSHAGDQRRPGQRGNEAAAGLLARLRPLVDDPHIPRPALMER